MVCVAVPGDNEWVSSKPVPKDVNPITSFLAVLSAVDSSDRIVIRVKDVGLWPSERLGGMVGPAIIAKASLAVGEDFEGFLEMDPIKTIPNNGAPVCQIMARFSEVGGCGSLPVPGQVAAVVDTFGAAGPWSSGVPVMGSTPADDTEASAPPLQTSQALFFGPEAAAAEQEEVDEKKTADASSCGPSTSSGVPESTSCGPAEHPEPQSASCGPAEPPEPQSASCGSESKSASSGAQESKSSRPLSSNSAFFVELGAFAFNEPVETIQDRLMDEQEGKRCGPYPFLPDRNYNVLAAGFSMVSRKHTCVWNDASAALLPDDKVVDPVLAQLAKLAPGHDHWCLGVPVLVSFVETIKANASVAHCLAAVIISTSHITSQDIW